MGKSVGRREALFARAHLVYSERGGDKQVKPVKGRQRRHIGLNAANWGSVIWTGTVSSARNVRVCGVNPLDG